MQLDPVLYGYSSGLRVAILVFAVHEVEETDPRNLHAAGFDVLEAEGWVECLLEERARGRNPVLPRAGALDRRRMGDLNYHRIVWRLGVMNHDVAVRIARFLAAPLVLDL